MTISEPKPNQMQNLRGLWKTAFGDTEDFLDMFFARAYAPSRCRCVLDEDRVAAVLYWFDCTCDGQPLAYIYAVATDPAYRNRGLCRRLMADTHAHLKNLGYAGAMLLPQDPGLRRMYGTMGYESATQIREFTCEAAGDPAALRELTIAEFAKRRSMMLPPGSVIQEGENLSYLAGYAKFYEGPGFLLTAFPDGDKLIGCELLGDVAKAPAILRAFGVGSGSFRCPGADIDWGMCIPFVDDFQKPGYFGFPFD